VATQLRLVANRSLEKLWVKRHDLVRTRHSGVAIKLKIFLKYITAVPISLWIM